ncbi:hypothetical protein EP10_001113 [Geobacillus icigianus]|uniref:AbrB/MazE/SpoVT family DNA-binding domain-containing protein n=1 Tax=Geobacillus icigianus TaxID=1430331 RepID=A0ABU6BEY6_9BACL|nr:hypothetical protein [Geobacillus icigianus]
MMLPLDELTSERQPERRTVSKAGRVETRASLVTKTSNQAVLVAPEAAIMAVKKGGTAERKPFRPFGWLKSALAGEKVFSYGGQTMGEERE